MPVCWLVQVLVGCCDGDLRLLLSFVDGLSDVVSPGEWLCFPETVDAVVFRTACHDHDRRMMDAQATVMMPRSQRSRLQVPSTVQECL